MEMELVNKTIGDCLAGRVKASPDKIAIEYWDKNYTWSEVDLVSDYLAVRMCSFGMKKGDHVGLWSVNTPNWVLTFLALLKIGAVPVLINTCYLEHELMDIIRYADIKYMYYGDGYKSLLYETMIDQVKREAWCRVERWIPIGRDGEGKWMTEKSFFTAEKSKKEMIKLARVKRQVQPEDIAGMLFTSGTTNIPKGVMLSHYNLVNNSLETAVHMKWNENDKLFLVVPLFHCFGITSGLLASIHAGCTIHLMKYFKTKKVLDHIDKYSCTVLNGVPSMFLAIIRNPAFSEYSLKSLRSGIIAGSPLSSKEYISICQRIPGIDLIPSYGQTETSPCVTIADREDYFGRKAETAGKPISHVELRIYGTQTGLILEHDKIGEIQVRGYNVMQGYYNLKKETEAVIMEDGWLRTGDLGYLDRDGYLHVVGRRKDMIIRAGENISPQEIESYIKDLSNVQDVKVIGIPADVVQEKIVACVVPVPGTPFSEPGILAYLKPRLAHYKIPSHVMQFQAFPMTASGKVLISELKKQVIDRLEQENKPD